MHAAAPPAPPLDPVTPPPVTPLPAAAPPRLESQTHQLLQANQARRRVRYEEVRDLARQGLGPAAIARRVGLTRQTVARWLRADDYPARAPTRSRRQLVTADEPYLRERWQAGCQNVRELWRELQAQGFTGGHETVRRLVVQWRTAPGRPGLPPRSPVAAPPAPPPTRPWSPRQARWLLVKPDDTLRPDQLTYLRHLGAQAPPILVGQRLTREFLQLIHAHDHAALAPWLAAAAGSGLPEFVEFAKGIARDRPAVDAALTTPWSNGQTEARVLQVKALRRQMRGRGGFALIRRCLVTAA